MTSSKTSKPASTVAHLLPARPHLLVETLPVDNHSNTMSLWKPFFYFCVRMNAPVLVLTGARKEGIRCLGTGVIRKWEFPSVNVRRQIWVLWKNSKGFLTLSHLPTSFFFLWIKFKEKKKNYAKPGLRQKQVGLCEFPPRLIYNLSHGQGYTQKPCLITNKQTKPYKQLCFTSLW